MRLSPLVVAVIALCPGCAWVQMEPGASEISVHAIGESMAACRNLGEIEVSVKSHVGPYERNSLSVRDELETLARNEALTLHADSVKPLAEPADGRQHWQAFRCRGAG